MISPTQIDFGGIFRAGELERSQRKEGLLRTGVKVELRNALNLDLSVRALEMDSAMSRVIHHILMDEESRQGVDFTVRR